MKELIQQQMVGKDVAYYDDKHYLDMVLQLLGTMERLMILMILMQSPGPWLWNHRELVVGDSFQGYPGQGCPG